MVKLGLGWVMVLATFTSTASGEGDVIFPATAPADEWWSNSIIYQVYPRSFKDSDNDGIGDLKGITQELDYFVDLGVKIVWINPIFKSPMDDIGYDVENYTIIDPIFGTMDDFKELISEMNKRDLKLIIELVPNHSSYKCEWFQKSIRREGKYAEYYVWRNASNQEQLGNSSVVPKPPNNWLSNFGGSAWAWNPTRKQFYLHQFNVKEPDFNYRNPDVHQEILDIMEFWLDKGVAGFRFNAVGKLYENKDFLDEPPSVGRENWPVYHSLDHKYTHDDPEVIGTVLEWRKFVDNYSKRTNTFPRLIVAEAHYHVCVFSITHYYGNATNPGVQVPLNYHLLTIVRKNDLVESVERAIQFWFEVTGNNTPNWVIETSDTSRIASEYGSEMVQVFTALKLTLPGIDVTYYGSELGMTNTYVRADQLQDSDDSGGQRNVGSRDFARTPMQWNNMDNAGFTKAKRPWLPVNSNYYQVNVESQKKVPSSNYNFYKKMSQLRRTSILKYGDLQTYNISDSIYIVKRSLPKRGSCLTVMNFGSETEMVVLSSVVGDLKKKLFVYLGSENSAYTTGNTVSTVSLSDEPLRLRPKSVVVLTDDEETLKSGSTKQIGSMMVSLSCVLLLLNVYFGKLV